MPAPLNDQDTQSGLFERLKQEKAGSKPGPDNDDVEMLATDGFSTDGIYQCPIPRSHHQLARRGAYAPAF
jgi:hypothetical protein